MARTPASIDVFAAVAEPRRRELIAVLSRRGATMVGDLVEAVRLPQPVVSKHLAVLRAVGLVAVRREGRMREYTLRGEKLKPVHEWVREYERFWNHQLGRIKDRAERRVKEHHSTAQTEKGQP